MIPQSKRTAKRRSAKTPKTSRRPVTAAVRLAELLAFVTAQGKVTLAEVAAEMGYATATARTYALILCEEGKIHRTAPPRTIKGMEHIYHAGPAPADLVIKVSPVNEFNRPTPKSYPPCHRRDLWACAMFPVPAVMLEQRL